eukprot:TRINITY_DN104608_c0_g1_i1.p1 TRINITY_DN104608_c0_g1~~TRINITY_DN104608_c0_g1_i1.p1  ORF type:complete len:1573 (+),score=330.14 TRINITY_DN104608_c0_g1_i1:248-4720(+)
MFPEADQDGSRKILVEIKQDSPLRGFQFVLHRKPDQWLKSGKNNFIVDFTRMESNKGFRNLVKEASDADPAAKVGLWSCGDAEVAVVAQPTDSGCNVQALVNSVMQLVLQYGPADSDQRWISSSRLPLETIEGNVSGGKICLSAGDIKKFLMFVLHEPSNNQWLKNGGRDFAFELPRMTVNTSSPQPKENFAPPARQMQRQPSKRLDNHFDEAIKQEPDAKFSSWETGDLHAAILASATQEECQVHVLVDSRADLVLQFGLAGEDRAWKSSQRLPLSRVQGSDERQEVLFTLPGGEVDPYFMFVLHDGAANRWFKNGSQDFEYELPRHEAWDELKKQEEARLQTEYNLRMKGKTEFLASRKERKLKSDIAFSAFELQGDAGSLDVSCFSTDDRTAAKVEIRAWLDPNLKDCVLHFGILLKPNDPWSCPSDQKQVTWPEGLVTVDKQACQYKLSKIDDAVYGMDFSIPAGIKKVQDEELVEPAISGIGFVLKAGGDQWIKPTDGSDAVARFSSAGRWKGEWADVAGKIVEQETLWNQMSLKRRYENCLDFVKQWEEQCEGMYMRRLPSWTTLVHVDDRQAEWSRMPSMPLLEVPDEAEIKQTKEEFWSWMFVWQRFSFMRLLTWEKNTCTQPRMLAGTTNHITLRMAELWKAHPRCRMWIRWTLATMGRGGSAGQAIRDQILVIMHSHDIKEIHGTYYEQWHQKLHNNTTPEDIGICRAVIKFLQTGGDMGEYWKVLHEHGIDKERLASYSRPITTEPYMVHTEKSNSIGGVARLIKHFEEYLDILRSVHDALDLQLAFDHAKSNLPASLQGKLQAVCNMGGTGFANLDDGHNKFLKVHAAREEMLSMLNHKDTPAHVVKDLLILDFTLETQQSVLVQGMTEEKRLPQLADQLKAMLTSLVGHLPMEDELQAILADWTSFASACAAQQWNGTTDSALLLKAMCDRMSRVVGELSDKCQTFMGPKAAFLGEAIGAPKRNIDVFVDEILRGTSLMAVSLALQRMEPVLRELAHLPPWQMISTVEKPIQGEFQLIDKMLNIQDKVFDTPTILLSGAVSGEEEVPDGVLGVLVRSAKEAPDILSHCAVRARNFGVLLATCFDPAISADLASKFEGKWVEVTCKSDGTVNVQEAERPTSTSEADMKASQDTGAKETEVRMNLTDSLGCPWVVRPDEMDDKNVGSKSLNLALLRPKIPADIHTPQAVALPFGTMQKALIDPLNEEGVLPRLQKTLGQLQPSTPNDKAMLIFEEAQHLVEATKMPDSLKLALKEAMAEVGKQDGEARLESLFKERDGWDAIKGVWSSLFAIRPWVSLAKAGRSFHDLNMAVLVQELVEARYAFVLHTVNPFTHDKDELYGELVAGRGETLVGNYPGRALSFAMKRGGEPRLISFPSKSVALHTQHCLIFRSDSNGEDLEGFAGAGLFESICAEEDKGGFLRLHRLPVVTDSAYRQKLLKRIAEVGWAIEKAFDGAPQDIEGCIDVNDRVFIVQSRPQV